MVFRSHSSASPGNILSRIGTGCFLGIWFLFILVPFLSLFLQLTGFDMGLLTGSSLAIRAVTTSFTTTAVSLMILVVVGLPTAYFMAKHEGSLTRYGEVLLDLPMVLPPAVAGVLLLLAFGRNGLIGSLLAKQGITITFSWFAVVLAQCFVAGPLFVKSAINGFRAIDPELEETALTLGKCPWQVFWQVTFPLALPSLTSGLVMAWARALGEFGATIIFAGNFPGRTQTLPLAIYVAMENNFALSMGLSALMVLISFFLLTLIKLLERKDAGRFRGAKG